MDIPRSHPARLINNFIVTDEPDIHFHGRMCKQIKVTNTIMDKSLLLVIVPKKCSAKEFIITELDGTRWFTYSNDTDIKAKLPYIMSFRKFYAALKRFDVWCEQNLGGDQYAGIC